MEQVPSMTADALRQKLSSGEAVQIVDIRSPQEREEWSIPGSIHMDIYERVKHHDPATFDNVHPDISVPIVTVCAGFRPNAASQFIALTRYPSNQCFCTVNDTLPLAPDKVTWIFQVPAIPVLVVNEPFV